MKQVYVIFALLFLLAGAAVTETYAKPKPGKHKSHKKSKKKKSGYYFNFQH